MYRHSPADMLTYGALAVVPSNPSNRFTRFVPLLIRFIPVRTGIGTQTRSLWRTWVRITAYAIPPFIHATLLSALVYVSLRDYLHWWLALPVACGMCGVFIWVGNIFLDRHIFKRLIWLRRARCHPFRTPDLAASNRELLDARRQIMLERGRSRGRTPRHRKGDPPRVSLGFVRIAPCTSPRWRTLIPLEVIAALYLPLGHLLFIPISIGLLMLFNRSHVGVFLLCVFLGILIMVALLTSPIIWLERRWKARIFGMLHGHCPQCRHDLSTLTAENSSAGPRRCPECGSHWPLVPPPTPTELREIEKQLSSGRAETKTTTSL